MYIYVFLFYLFVHNFIFLIVKGNVKNLFINTTCSVIASHSFSHFHLNSHSRHIYPYTVLGYVLFPNSKVAFRPLDRCHLFPCLTS